jgi:Cu-processing system permease protein
MSSTGRVLRNALSDVIRRRWVLAYTLFFAGVTEGLLWLGGGGSRVAVSLLDVVLLIIPLVSIAFSTLYVYNAQGFLELLLSQPVSRRGLFLSLWVALVLPLSVAFVMGVGIPLALSGEPSAVTCTMLGTGVALTIIFVALGLAIASSLPDRIKGLGLAVAAWLATTVVYDGLVLILATMLGARAAAAPVLSALALNPVDLARVLLLTRLDAPALMAYSDAVLQRLIGGQMVVLVTAVGLAMWCVVPTALGLRAFRRRDW